MLLILYSTNNQAIYLETSIVIQSVLMSRVSLLQRVSCGCMVLRMIEETDFKVRKPNDMTSVGLQCTW